jgi:hypothetical protein
MKSHFSAVQVVFLLWGLIVCVIITLPVSICMTLKAAGFNLTMATKAGRKNMQFLPYGRSIGSWICLTHKTYTCHTVQNTQNTYSASMAVSDSQSIFRFNLCCLSYSALFRFLSRMRCRVHRWVFGVP